MKINILTQSVQLSLLAFIFLTVGFADIDCGSNKKKNQQVQRLTPKAPTLQTVVTTGNGYEKQVEQKPLNSAINLRSSVDEEVISLPDGSIQIVKKAVEPMPEQGKVVTTTETWTVYDYAKLVAGVGALAGLVYAGGAYANYNQTADEFKEQAGNQDWRLNNDIRDPRALDMFAQKIEQMSPEEKADLKETYEKVLKGAAIGGSLAGAVIGGGTGAQVGTGAGALLGVAKGIKSFRTGGTPRQIAAKLATNTLAGFAAGTAGGAVVGGQVGSSAGALVGGGALLASDLINTMDVPRNYVPKYVNSLQDKQV